jgi:hypothetical protein
MDSDNKVQWVYSSQNEDELTERYDEWAKTYDEDLHGHRGHGPVPGHAGAGPRQERV